MAFVLRAPFAYTVAVPLRLFQAALRRHVQPTPPAADACAAPLDGADDATRVLAADALARAALQAVLRPSFYCDVVRCESAVRWQHCIVCAWCVC